MNFVLFIFVTLPIPKSLIPSYPVPSIAPGMYYIHSIIVCIMNKWKKNASIKCSYWEVCTLAHAILHFWSTLAFFPGLLVPIYLLWENDGAIIALLRLTCRIIEWQSWKGPFRWSPKLLLTSEPHKRRPEADFSKLPFIWNPETTSKCKWPESFMYSMPYFYL